MNLDNSSALVTGGASGLGAATAHRLAAAGVRVTLLDLNEAAGNALADELDGAFVRADVTDAEQVQEAVDTAPARLELLVLEPGRSTATGSPTT